MDTSLQLDFFKYQGTGNDFVLLDNRLQIFPKKDTKLVAKLCDRKFGIGADGLILLEEDNSSDFKMVYYNADGKESTMCGNGGRCLVAFAHYLGLVGDGETLFNAIDGLHKATIKGDMVTLWMNDVNAITSREHSFFLDTGSPHHVQLVSDLKAMDVKSEGAKLRYGLYGESGSNINFVTQLNSEAFKVRTYERGVEDETLSCGTGVTAVAIAMHHAKQTDAHEITVAVEGGSLRVAFDFDGATYSNVRLMGPATYVFKGQVEC